VHELAYEPIPLICLTAGQCGVVLSVLGSSDHVHRMRELGVREGAEVEMLQGGSPCIVRLGGQRFCLRGDDLGGVLVRLGRNP